MKPSSGAYGIPQARPDPTLPTYELNRVALRLEGENTRLRAYLGALLRREPDGLTILRAEEWNDLGVRWDEAGAVLSAMVNQVFDPATGNVTLWVSETREKTEKQ